MLIHELTENDVEGLFTLLLQFLSEVLDSLLLFLDGLVEVFCLLLALFKRLFCLCQLGLGLLGLRLCSSSLLDCILGLCLRSLHLVLELLRFLFDFCHVSRV